MPFPADGQRKLPVRDDDDSRTAIVAFIQQHRDRLGRAERIADEGSRVRAPSDDVDLFTVEFNNDVLNAIAAHAYTTADRFHTRLQCCNRHLGTIPWLACKGLDLHDALVYLRYLTLQQAAQHMTVSAAEAEYRSAAAPLHLHQISSDQAASMVTFVGKLVLPTQHALGLLDVDDHIARARDKALHPAGDNLPLSLGEVLIGVLALRFAYALHDDLLSRLRGDAPEVVRRAFEGHRPLEFSLRIYVPRLSQGYLQSRIGDFLHHLFLDVDMHLPRHGVNPRLDVAARHAVVTLVGRYQRHLEGFQDCLRG